MESKQTAKRRFSRRSVVVLSFLPIVLLVVVATVLWIDFSSVLYMRRAQRLTIESNNALLAADFIVPRGFEPPYPAAVIVHGSGRITRAKLRPWVWKLRKSGLAVLIYDKRGTGKSTGVYNNLGSIAASTGRLQTLAGDAAAAFEWLQANPLVDPTRVGFIGGSQAGWIMPLASQQVDGVAFIVGISAPAVTFGQEELYSQLTGNDPGFYFGLSQNEIDQRLAAFAGPHGYDPATTLRDLKPPMLWILGGQDKSVPTALSVRNIEAIQHTGPTNHEVIVYLAGDHNIRDSTTDKRIDYWPDIIEWLQEHEILRSR